MGNLTFQEIFRHALPGGIALLVLFGVYAPCTECDSQLDVVSIGGAAVLSLVALVLVVGQFENRFPPVRVVGG